MTHINPGTDTTINPVIINDTYRQQRHSSEQPKEYIITEDKIQGIETAMSKWMLPDAGKSLGKLLRSRPHTPAQPSEAQCPHWKDASNLKSDFRDQIQGDHYCDLPSEAQQRIDAAIEILELQIGCSMMLSDDGDNWSAYDELQKEAKRATALLQAGEPK